MLTLELDTPAGQLQDDVRKCAVGAAQALLDKRGITLEQCLAADTRLANQHQPTT